MLLNYKGSKTIQNQSDFNTDSTRIISNMKMLFREMDVRTEVVGNKIKYKEILRDLGSGDGKPRTFFPLKEGEIRLFWSDMDKINLEWEIKLDSLLFFTFLIGLIVGCLSYFFLNTMLIGSIIIGAASRPFLFIIWRQWIVLEIKDLIETSCFM